MTKLALGTVQFGLSYGISNFEGQTPQTEVNNILNLAYKNSINTLDTSCNYGNAEQAIGNFQDHCFNVITKTPAFDDTITTLEANRIITQFSHSVQTMKHHNISTILLHHGENLTKPHGDLLYQALMQLKQQKLVDNIGVSIYDPAQLAVITQHFDIDVVQLPLNLFDQTILLDGTLTKLANKGIEIHCRSIFLQGLLLMDIARLPNYFSPIKAHLFNFHQYLKKRCISPLTAAYRFAEQIPEISKIICGVNNKQQLQQLIDIDDTPLNLIELAEFSLADKRYTCPVNWPQ